MAASSREVRLSRAHRRVIHRALRPRTAVRLCAATALTAALCSLAHARLAPAAAAPPLPITVDAESPSEIDYAKNEVVLRKVKISQGGMSIAADQAVATGQSTSLNFDDSVWVFRGSVKIITEQGLLDSDEADATFSKGVLEKAVIIGKPAVFLQRNPKNGKPVRGHAERIVYDVAKGTVTLTKDAWLNNGADEIHGEQFTYNMLEKKVTANPAEQNSQRIHMTITQPPPQPSKP
jgi:lipopolysaccharide export system protein LptA